MKNKPLTILGIETSCDDTSVAILKIENCKLKTLANIVSSQVEIHKKWGGVYPSMAKREHQKNLVPVLAKALEKAEMLKKSKCQNPNVKSNPKLKRLNTILERELDLKKKLIRFLQKYEKPDIDLIVVTIGPGLEPCLWVGVNFTKALAYYWKLPIIPVNHIEAHILINFLETNSKFKNQNSKSGTRKSGCKIQNLFPAIALVVSGGHTQLILIKGVGKYKVLGETRDDAAGECFDKTARILDLGYPGGPIISQLASKADRSPTPIKLPRPMMYTKDYDFSFSGLKTAVLYAWQKIKLTSITSDRSGKELIKIRKQMCVEIQQAVIDVLLKKTIKAAKDFKAKTIILGGGVAANEELRKQFSERVQGLGPRVQLLIPPVNLATDNALMTAIAAYFNSLKGKKQNWYKIKADSNLRI